MDPEWGCLRSGSMNAPLCNPGRVDEDCSDEPRVVRALLFDLGGVVIGFDFNGAFRLWASRAGCDPTLIAERFSIDEAYERHERGELPASSYFPALRESLDIDISEEELVEGWNDVYLGLVPGISEVLSAAETHWPLFAFTNSNPTHKSAWSVSTRTNCGPLERSSSHPTSGYASLIPKRSNSLPG